jgi:hypothetical protein
MTTRAITTALMAVCLLLCAVSNASPSAGVDYAYGLMTLPQFIKSLWTPSTHSEVQVVCAKSPRYLPVQEKSESMYYHWFKSLWFSQEDRDVEIVQACSPRFITAQVDGSADEYGWISWLFPPETSQIEYSCSCTPLEAPAGKEDTWLKYFMPETRQIEVSCSCFPRNETDGSESSPTIGSSGYASLFLASVLRWRRLLEINRSFGIAAVIGVVLVSSWFLWCHFKRDDDFVMVQPEDYAEQKEEDVTVTSFVDGSTAAAINQQMISRDSEDGNFIMIKAVPKKGSQQASERKEEAVSYFVDGSTEAAINEQMIPSASDQNQDADDSDFVMVEDIPKKDQDAEPKLVTYFANRSIEEAIKQMMI